MSPRRPIALVAALTVSALANSLRAAEPSSPPARWEDALVTCDFNQTPLAEALAEMARQSGQPMRADPAATGSVLLQGTVQAGTVCLIVAAATGTHWCCDNGTLVFRPTEWATGPEAVELAKGGNYALDRNEFLDHVPAAVRDGADLALSLHQPVAMRTAQTFTAAVQSVASLLYLSDRLGSAPRPAIPMTVDDSVTGRGWPIHVVPTTDLPAHELLTILGWQVGADWRIADRGVVFSAAPGSAPALAALAQPCPFATDGLEVTEVCARLAQELDLDISVDQVVWPVPRFAQQPADLPLHALLMSIPGLKFEIHQGAIVVTSDISDPPRGGGRITVGEPVAGVIEY